MMTRREIVAGAAAAAVAQAKTLASVGVQLYTVRTVLPQKAAETLKAIEAIGFKEVEAVGASVPGIWDALKATSLKPVSVHLDTAMFLKNKEALPKAIDDAAGRGFKFVVCPFIAPADRGGEEVIKRLAATLNEAGERARKAGMLLCYHNHAFEFAKAGDRTLLDVLMAESDRKLVSLELDVMWVTVAGVDPVALLNQYKGRVALMHLKDLHKGEPNRLDERIARTSFAEVGKGRIDFAAVLRAASKAGVKHYFVEQDQTPGDPLDSLKQSFSHLKTLSF